MGNKDRKKEWINLQFGNCVAKRGLSDTSNKGLQYVINQNIKITISKGYNCAKKVYIASKIAPSDRDMVKMDFLKSKYR